MQRLAKKHTEKKLIEEHANVSILRQTIRRARCVTICYSLTSWTTALVCHAQWSRFSRYSLGAFI